MPATTKMRHIEQSGKAEFSACDVKAIVLHCKSYRITG